MDNEVLNKDLIKAMINFNNNPSMETERKIYLELKEALFLMPVIVTGEYKVLDGRIIEILDNAEVKMARFNKDNKVLYPSFTDMTEVNRWNSDLEKDDIYLIKMRFNDYEKLLSTSDEIDGFVINPYHQDLIISELQIQRYHEILFEEEHKDAYTTPITKLLDELRNNYSTGLEDRIYRMFQNLRLLMPIQVPNSSCISSLSEEGVAELVENTPINVMPLENEKGEQLFPVFTDLYEAKCSGIDVDVDSNRYLIEINFDGLESLVAMNPNVIGFSINPFNHNIIIGPEQFEKFNQLKGDFASSSNPIHVDDQDKLAKQLDTTPEEEDQALSEFVSDPYQLEMEIHNEKLEKNLSKLLLEFDSVNKAYLVQKMYLDHDNYLLVIDKERDGKNIIGQLKQEVQSLLKNEDSGIEFLSHNEEEAQSIIKSVTPFYEKGKKKRFLGLF